MNPQTSERETWQTHMGMIFAMIGTAVGLGNIWRFPYLCGKYGGGAFMIPYLIILLGAGIFAVMCEWVLGRYTRRESLGAFEKIGFPAGRKIGAWGIVGPFFLYSYYAVITAWVLFFTYASLKSLYFGQDTKTFFLEFISSPSIFVAHALCVGITSMILSFGVKNGIERSCRIMIPALFILLAILAIRSCTLPGALEGIEFFMRPRWSGLWDPASWIAAMGQVFFTLSLGMGAMLIYGSYMKGGWGIPKNAVAVSLGNASASLLAGFVIFPAAFALGFAQDISGQEGIALTFFVIPKIFEQMPGGALFATLFFITLSFGALSSAISIQEPGIAWLKEEVGWSRKKSAVLTGLLLWLMGLPFIINGWLPGGGLGNRLALLSKMDSVIGSLTLPFFGLLSVLAVGWCMNAKGFEEINRSAHHKLGNWIQPWIRWVVPTVMLFIFLLNLGKFLADLKWIPQWLPTRTTQPFVPSGIDFSTVMMALVVCGIIWGGCIFLTWRAVVVERSKERGGIIP
jgi:neurotransmitter:Na+ symporter, NSS family